MEWDIFFFVLGGLSMVFSLIVPLMYYFHPKTRQHPNIILVIICLTEFSEMYHQLLKRCQLKYLDGIDELTNNSFSSLFYSSTRNCNDRNYDITTYLITFELNLYIVWCFDLVLTLRNPLATTKFRFLIYVPFTILMTIIQTYYYQDGKYHVNIFIVSLQYLISFMTIIFCLILIIRAYKIQNKMIRVIKTKYLTQQVISLLLVMFTNSLQVIQGLSTSDTRISSCVVLSQGILFGLLRLQEKYFRRQLFKSFCQILRIKNNITVEGTYDSQDQSWNIPLFILHKTTQTYNIMSGILEGIQWSMQQNEIISENYSSQTRQHTIQIKNTEYFECTEDADEVNRSENTGINDNQSIDSKATLILKNETIQMEFKEYAPAVFSHLRKSDLINASEIEDSLSVLKNQDAIKVLSQSMGSSGAIFFKNHNNRYLIKTLKKSELEFFIKILPKYQLYISQNNKSLLARIYGCYCIELQHTAPIYLILMENTFKIIQEPYLSYDMKGSLIDRKTNNLIFGKDLDFVEHQEFILLEKNVGKFLKRQIKKDSKFLQALHIMDYSLLLGISQHKLNVIEKQGATQAFTARMFINPLNNQQYSFGIIDYLQEYDTLKFLENKFKSIINLSRLISSVAPNFYSKRFNAFINSIICIVQQH